MEGTANTRAPQLARSTPEVATHRRVFISYARADAPHAHQVERSCAYWGLQSWMDQRKLGGGENWTVALDRAIDASQALALVLTPAALASEMVRREYLRALSRGIPVLLVRFRAVGALPAELANARVINFRDIRTAGASLYFALADLGLAQPPAIDRLDAISSYAVMADLADRAPAEWRVYHVPMSAYWRRAFVAALPLLMALAVAAGGELLLPRDAPADFYMTYLLVMIASFALAAVALRPGPRLILTLARRIQQEVVILQPDGCDISSRRKEGNRLTALPTRYSYRWAASARMSVGFWGAVRVVFTDATNGRQVSVSLPNGLPRRRAIAQRIVADVAAFQASRGQAASTALRPLSQTALAPAVQTPASPSESRTLYSVIAPRGYDAVLASAQAWLGRRAIFPVEAIRGPEDGISLPSARDAARIRFALFVDVPAITQSPRCQAILSDLRRRGVLLIPLRVTTQTPEPSAWSTTQWVDFSPRVARERSLLGLCDALDRAGIPLATSPREFDAELALARGVFQRTPPEWRVFTADPGMEQAMRRLRRREATLSAISVAGLAALDLFTTGQIISSPPPGSSERGSLITGGVILFALLMGALAPVWLRVPKILRQARLHGDILRDYQAPELLVITPRGIAYHVVDETRGGTRGRGAHAEPAPFQAQQGFLAGGVAFGDLAGVERARGRRGASLLRLRTASGDVRDLPLSNFASEGEAATLVAIEAFAAFRVRSER